MATTIVIADDHPLILKGLNDYLCEKDYDVIAKAKNGKEALTLIKAHQPDIAFLDIQMPFLTGLQVAEQCEAEGLKTKIIIITFEKCDTIYQEAKSINTIFGYILKEFAIAEIENCISIVLEGDSYYSPELITFLEINETPEALKTLTETELKVLKLVLANKTAKDIGGLLFCSDRTVEKHKSNIRTKLNLSSNSQSMAIYAKEHEDFLLKYT